MMLSPICKESTLRTLDLVVAPPLLTSFSQLPPSPSSLSTPILTALSIFLHLPSSSPLLPSPIIL